MKFAPFSPLPMGNTKLDKNPELRRKYPSISALLKDYAPQMYLCREHDIAEVASSDYFIDEENMYFLGIADNKAYIAWDITRHDIAAEWKNPREFACEKTMNEMGIIAMAYGLAHWHRHHHFCANCGSASHSFLLGEARECSNSLCETITYPRIDPSMITLLTHQFEDGEKALLIQMHRRPEIYTTISGFMSVGETIEETVIREIKEETGIIASDLQYIANQPWPFPQSLMLGYRATAITTDITIEKEELINARWFSKEEVRALGRSDNLPPPEAISRHLIEQWLHED